MTPRKHKQRTKAESRKRERRHQFWNPLSVIDLQQAQWGECRRCRLGDNKTPVIQVRWVGPGPQVPMDAMLVGEAPGSVETVKGVPFVGPAGRLLDALLAQVVLPKKWVGAITNTVACWPQDRDRTVAPTSEQCAACWPRVEGLLDAWRPPVVIALGRTAEKVLKAHAVPCVALEHPASILRAGGLGTVAAARWVLLFRREVLGAQI